MVDNKVGVVIIKVWSIRYSSKLDIAANSCHHGGIRVNFTRLVDVYRVPARSQGLRRWVMLQYLERLRYYGLDKK